MGIRSGDMPVCVRVQVKRSSKWALLVVDEADRCVEEWIPRSQIHDGGEVGPESHVGMCGVMCIPRWLAQDRGFEWW